MDPGPTSAPGDAPPAALLAQVMHNYVLADNRTSRRTGIGIVFSDISSFTANLEAALAVANVHRAKYGLELITQPLWHYGADECQEFRRGDGGLPWLKTYSRIYADHRTASFSIDVLYALVSKDQAGIIKESEGHYRMPSGHPFIFLVVPPPPMPPWY